jgi:hypothetical protein
MSGKAQVFFDTRSPRAGAPLEGRVRLPGAPSQSRRYVITLKCWRHVGTDEFKETGFEEEIKVEAEQRGEHWVLPFRIDIPAYAPPSTPGASSWRDGYQWEMDCSRADGLLSTVVSLNLKMGPATAEQLDALDAACTPAEMVLIRGAEGQLGRRVLPHERRVILAMTHEERAELGRYHNAVYAPARAKEALPPEQVRQGCGLMLLAGGGLALVVWLLFR